MTCVALVFSLSLIAVVSKHGHIDGSLPAMSAEYIWRYPVPASHLDCRHSRSCAIFLHRVYVLHMCKLLHIIYRYMHTCILIHAYILFTYFYLHLMLFNDHETNSFSTYIIARKECYRSLSNPRS